ncbi:hypothetical protein PCE1_001145 [Barthelona sp. PCE]
MMRIGQVYIADNNFEAETEQELSFSKGDLFTLKEIPEDPEDWILVSRYSDSNIYGFVPGTFISIFEENEPHPISEEEEFAEIQPANATFEMQTDSPSKLSKRLATPILSSTLRASKLRESMSFSTAASRIRLKEKHTRLSQAMKTVLNRTVTPDRSGDSFNELFTSHQKYFDETVAKRDELFGEISNHLNAAEESLVSIESAHVSISKKIGDLERKLEKTQAKWRIELQSELEENVYSAVPEDL